MKHPAKYLFENPVLQRELLSNLRMKRSFILLLVYLGLLGSVVYVAWPRQERIDLSQSTGGTTGEAKQLVELFFLGQFILASLIAPSFAAGSITGEKERKTYEMLVASPLTPGMIIWGKLLASLAHVAILVFSSLPIVVLCLPLGGVSIYEVIAAYVALFSALAAFSMISLACSTFLQRTLAALLISYLTILPLAITGALFWWVTSGALASVRLQVSLTVLPMMALVTVVGLFIFTWGRLLRPPDVGSEGKEVVDEEREMREAVGMVIQRGRFPDSLFAPAKRTDLLEDGTNPVLEKEMRSEIFSQGTLMLRVVIQISMLMAIPMMLVCFYLRMPEMAPWYVCYVILFNLLVGPAFSAGTIAGERERQTLDLLLTTTLSPWQILSAKLISGLRVSAVLTMFLAWPLLLACLWVPQYHTNLFSMFWYLVLILVACLTTVCVALFCSVAFRKTSTALMVAYAVLAAMYVLPVAAEMLTSQFFQGLPAQAWAHGSGMLSPFSAAFAVPLIIDGTRMRGLDWPLHLVSPLFLVTLNVALMGLIARLFMTRWRMAQ